ncbi:hypothetical protein [uncultured Roseivirga sp.]|uniref:hypothetical protein n=1 Tax=uncultured Roseivirga sp. TaxID=543088 RepID=UPI0030DACB28|tara:strand:+ start:5797 stop:6501 length:705 start_codon:yes stop_codon:yes gene_type:complete
MPSTPLTQEQIAAIKTFIKKRGFNTIEVEMEALDHMASKIEALLEEKPDMNFDLAITKAHASFGIYGLSTLAESIEGSLLQRFKRQFFKELLFYFNSTKIFIPMALTALGYFLLTQYPANDTGMYLHSGFLIYGFLLAIIPYLIFRKRMSRWEKRSSFAKMSTYGLYITQFIFSQGFGLVTKILYEQSSSAFPYVFVAGFVLTSLTIFINYDLMKWGIATVNEKWAKYIPEVAV